MRVHVENDVDQQLTLPFLSANISSGGVQLTPSVNLAMAKATLSDMLKPSNKLDQSVCDYLGGATRCDVAALCC